MKSCPFCGSDNVGFDRVDVSIVRVVCSNCGSFGPAAPGRYAGEPSTPATMIKRSDVPRVDYYFEEIRHLAKNAWNRREETKC
jgi:hypothetical protein